MSVFQPFPTLGNLLAALICLTGLSACTSIDSALPAFIKTYRIDVQQGNVVTQEMVQQLQVGMTRNQVRFILGTPLINDPFRPERWEYTFRFQQGTGKSELRRFIVVFVDERLTEFGSDQQPTENKGQQTVVTVGKKPGDIKIEKVNNTLASDVTAPGVSATAASNEPLATPGSAENTPPTNAPVAAATQPDNRSNNVASKAQLPVALPMPAEVEATLRGTIEGWRAAWVNRVPFVYLSYYSPSYKIENMSRAEWEQSRRERLTKPSRINLLLGNLRMELLAPDRAKVVFRQVYESDIAREVGTKTLLLRNMNGRWLIEFEQFSPQ